MFEIWVEHTFAAGHALRNYHGKCENVHGHNYRVRVGIEGQDVDENGMLHDFADLKKRLRATSEYLDHQFINDLKPFDEFRKILRLRRLLMYAFGRQILPARFIGPNLRFSGKSLASEKFRVLLGEFRPLFGQIVSGENSRDRADGYAGAAIDTFDRVDV